MVLDNSGYHRAVSAELDRARRLGYSPEHDDENPIDHLLQLAFQYISEGKTVKGGAMIISARAWLQRNTKNSFQRDIEKFMHACDQEVRKYPGLPSAEIKQLRINLMIEELLGSTTPSGVLVQSKSDELIQSIMNDDLVGIADGLADVIYVVVGTAAAYGIDLQEVFDEVQRSNMTKAVWDEENQTWFTLKNEFGKVLKPETFSEANLEPIVLRQISEGEAMEAYLAEAAASEDENISVTVGTIEL